jgi:hypothetical protein
VRWRRLTLGTWPLASCAVLAGCLTPAPNDTVYQAKAASAVEAAISEVETARLAVTTLLDGRATGAYADVVLTESETELGPIQGSFASVQPPHTDTADIVRGQVLDLLSQAEDALADARIAARRGDQAALGDSVSTLHQLGSQLEAAKADLK